MTSQNELLFTGFLYGFVTSVVGILAWNRAVDLYHLLKFEYEYMKHPRLVTYDLSKSCDDFDPEKEHRSHDWQDCKLFVRGLEFGVYSVCQACGEIRGRKDFMVSKEVLEQMREATRLMNEKLAAEARIKKRVFDVFEGYLWDHVKKINVDPTKGTRLAQEVLKNVGLTAIKLHFEAEMKVAEEVKAQAELDDKYKDWPNKVKGNA